jgi:hypothetical protein
LKNVSDKHEKFSIGIKQEYSFFFQYPTGIAGVKIRGIPHVDTGYRKFAIPDTSK